MVTLIGLVNGVIVGGFGLGAFVFNQVQSSYLNPGLKNDFLLNMDNSS